MKTILPSVPTGWTRVDPDSVTFYDANGLQTHRQKAVKRVEQFICPGGQTFDLAFWNVNEEEWYYSPDQPYRTNREYDVVSVRDDSGNFPVIKGFRMLVTP